MRGRKRPAEILTKNEVVRVPGEGDRSMKLRLGDFYWQDPGVTRTVRNIGTSKVELIEIEFK